MPRSADFLEISVFAHVWRVERGGLDRGGFAPQTPRKTDLRMEFRTSGVARAAARQCLSATMDKFSRTPGINLIIAVSGPGRARDK